MDVRDPLAYPLSTYVWVVAVSVAAGFIRYLNMTDKLSLSKATRDLISSGGAGIVAFWFLEWYAVEAPLNAVIIAICGYMGVRFWVELEKQVNDRISNVKIGGLIIRSPRPPDADPNKGQTEKPAANEGIKDSTEVRHERTN